MTFNSETTSVQVSVTVFDDDQSEPREEFMANLTLITTDLDVEITPGTATINIIDNDGMIVEMAYCIAPNV